MSLSAKKCPDCERMVREPFKETMTGRKVCPDCARTYRTAMGVAMQTGNAGAGAGVWAALMQRLRRHPK